MAKKLSYEKPFTIVYLVQCKSHLLQASPTTGKFTDDEPYNGWDVGGANSNEVNVIWDEYENNSNT